MCYLWSTCCYLSSFLVASTLEQVVEFSNKQVFSPWQITPGGNFQSQVWVLEVSGNVLNDVIFLYTD